MLLRVERRGGFGGGAGEFELAYEGRERSVVEGIAIGSGDEAIDMISRLGDTSACCSIAGLAGEEKG